ncbi:class I SAM-dependent methyltransferase [Actinospica robiniae]|uniref:class I SAM-dependent methyltransferase n=1 Tax=Actinospica robiniae TaxID=304901 RepID=UPI00041F273A|nr:methyltransferase [Actinospica robiniae]
MSLASRIHGSHQHGHNHNQTPDGGRDQRQNHLVEQDGDHDHDRTFADSHGYGDGQPAGRGQTLTDGHGRGHGWHGSGDGSGNDSGHGHDRGHAHGHAGAHGNADTTGITLHHSRSYDGFVNAFFAGRRPAVFRKLAGLSGAEPGDRALDVGCGTGYLTSMLAAAVAPGGSVSGVDASAAMVAEANRLRSSTHCTYTVGAAERLEFEDGRFDVVTSSLMLHHLPTELRVPALREMRRVLRPGGRVLIAEFRPPRTGLGRRVVGAITDPAMQEDQRPLLPGLFREAGFPAPLTGDLRPWVTYAIATRG